MSSINTSKLKPFPNKFFTTTTTTPTSHYEITSNPKMSITLEYLSISPESLLSVLEKFNADLELFASKTSIIQVMGCLNFGFKERNNTRTHVDLCNSKIEEIELLIVAIEMALTRPTVKGTNALEICYREICTGSIWGWIARRCRGAWCGTCGLRVWFWRGFRSLWCFSMAFDRIICLSDRFFHGDFDWVILFYYIGGLSRLFDNYIYSHDIKNPKVNLVRNYASQVRCSYTCTRRGNLHPRRFSTTTRDGDLSCWTRKSLRSGLFMVAWGNPVRPGNEIRYLDIPGSSMIPSSELNSTTPEFTPSESQRKSSH